MAAYTVPAKYDGILPAVAATAAWLGTGAALDIYLVSNHKRPITDVLRTAPGKLFLVVLGLHVANYLGKADPFRGAAVLIQRRWPEAEVLAEVLDPE